MNLLICSNNLFETQIDFYLVENLSKEKIDEINKINGIYFGQIDDNNLDKLIGEYMVDKYRIDVKNLLNKEINLIIETGIL